MRRILAFLLFILILLVCFTMLGIYLRNKFISNQIEVVSVKVDIYKLKNTEIETDNRPYKTITLAIDENVTAFMEAFDEKVEISATELPNYGISNCLISINYRKSTQHNLYTDTYEAWYDENKTKMILIKFDNTYYQIPYEESQAIYALVDNK